MAHFDVARQQHGLHRLGQVQQAQQIAGGAAAAPHGLRGLLVRQTKLVDQALQALCLFQRIEVFALHVLDQRHGCSGVVIHIAHQHRHLAQSSQMGGTETPFACDDFVLARMLPFGELAHQNGLHDALRLDAFGQFVQRAFIHAGARLVLSGNHFCQPQFRRGAFCTGCFRGACAGAKQGFQPAAEAFFSGCHGDSYPFRVLPNCTKNGRFALLHACCCCWGFVGLQFDKNMVCVRRAKREPNSKHASQSVG